MENNYLSLGQSENRIREVRGSLDFSSVETISTNNPTKEIFFKVRETIQASTYQSIGELHIALRSKEGSNISCLATNILNKNSEMIISPFKEIKSAEISVQELGFKGGATYVDICVGAVKQGLHFCPIEFALKLCLQHHLSLKSEWMHIAMDPMKDFYGNPVIFKVQFNVAKSYLDTICGFSSCYFNADSIFKFCL